MLVFFTKMLLILTNHGWNSILNQINANDLIDRNFLCFISGRWGLETQISSTPKSLWWFLRRRRFAKIQARTHPKPKWRPLVRQQVSGISNIRFGQYHWSGYKSVLVLVWLSDFYHSILELIWIKGSYLDQILPQHESFYPIGLISARIKIPQGGSFFNK